MFLVDTNVLVYAANRDASEHPPCSEKLEHWRAQATPWYLTWGIVYEFLRVVTHSRVLRDPWTPKGAWSFIEAVLASETLRILSETPQHRAVLNQMLADIPELRGNLLFDAHTAALMHEHGVKRIVTRDTDFHRFPFLEVVDPLS